MSSSFFFFNDTATTEIYTLSLHDALPILSLGPLIGGDELGQALLDAGHPALDHLVRCIRHNRFEAVRRRNLRSEEHTSELQSRQYIVCRLLLEKKNSQVYSMHSSTRFFSW